MYRILSKEHLIGRTIEEDEIIRKTNISAEFDSYSLEDYTELFKICNFLQDTLGENNLWSISRGLDIVFELLETKPDFYVDVIEEYFRNNAPFRLNGYRQVGFLLSNIGYDKTYNILNGADYQGKDTWLSLIWECINDNDITETVISDYNAFSEKNLEGNNPIVPPIRVLLRYGERDNGLKNRILNQIAEKTSLSAAFLGYAYRDDDINAILDLFKDNYDTLSQTYMNALEISDHLDYGGKLFIKIFEQRPSIWKQYVDWVKDHSRRDGYEQKIFDQIWDTEKWKECIDYAYSVIVDDDMDFYIEHPAQLLFGRSEQEADVVKNRKRQWLLDRLHENCADVDKCSKLIDVVVNVMPQWKQEFILEYIKGNKSVEDFKKIHLFPMSASWSGSEVPLILDKIEFLKNLKEKMKGVAYIEHREYIDEYRRDLEAYKRNVELREYLEEADYA